MKIKNCIKRFTATQRFWIDYSSKCFSLSIFVVELYRVTEMTKKGFCHVSQAVLVEFFSYRSTRLADQRSEVHWCCSSLSRLVCHSAQI